MIVTGLGLLTLLTCSREPTTIFSTWTALCPPPGAVAEGVTAASLGTTGPLGTVVIGAPPVDTADCASARVVDTVMPAITSPDAPSSNPARYRPAENLKPFIANHSTHALADRLAST
jgi:hypothetical protein